MRDIVHSEKKPDKWKQNGRQSVYEHAKERWYKIELLYCCCDLQSKTTGLHNHQRINTGKMNEKKKENFCWVYKKKQQQKLSSHTPNHVSDFLWSTRNIKRNSSIEPNKNIVITNLCLILTHTHSMNEVYIIFISPMPNAVQNFDSPVRPWSLRNS